MFGPRYMQTPIKCYSRKLYLCPNSSTMWFKRAISATFGIYYFFPIKILSMWQETGDFSEIFYKELSPITMSLIKCGSNFSLSRDLRLLSPWIQSVLITAELSQVRTSGTIKMHSKYLIIVKCVLTNVNCVIYSLFLHVTFQCSPLRMKTLPLEWAISDRIHNIQVTQKVNYSLHGNSKIQHKKNE